MTGVEEEAGEILRPQAGGRLQLFNAPIFALDFAFQYCLLYTSDAADD